LDSSTVTRLADSDAMDVELKGGPTPMGRGRNGITVLPSFVRADCSPLHRSRPG